MIEGIEIRPVTAKPGVSGPTYEWCNGVPGQQVTFCVRHAGTVSGNHYHLGADPSKRPERFILLEGEGTFVACDGKQTLEVSLTPFTEVLISPLIVHALHAKTSILFAEYRQTVYDREHPDTFGADSYRDELNRHGGPIIDASLAEYFRRVTQFTRM